MPDTSDSSATTMTSIATRNLTATYTLWSQLFETQTRFASRLFEAMGTRSNQSRQEVSEPLPDDVVVRRASAPAAPAATEFPIKRYDTLTVEEITGKLDRLRDVRSIRIVLAYEAKNKARKGVAAAGEARLNALSDS